MPCFVAHLSQYTLRYSGISRDKGDLYRKIFAIFLDGIYCYHIGTADVF